MEVDLKKERVVFEFHLVPLLSSANTLSDRGGLVYSQSVFSASQKTKPKTHQLVT